MTPTLRANGPFGGNSTFESSSFIPNHHKKPEDARSLSNPGSFSVRSGPYASTVVPATVFSTSDLRSTISRLDNSRTDLGVYGPVDDNVEELNAEQKQAYYKDRIEKELKIKVGSENLLEALNAKNQKQNKEQRRFVEDELNATNQRIARLKSDMDVASKRNSGTTSSNAQTNYSMSGGGMFGSRVAQSPTWPGGQSEPSNTGQTTDGGETENPTFVLAELLQALESETMSADYYVNHANDLVSLLKRHPMLKYDLAWSIFGLRMQSLLLSNVREVIASAYRVIRHAITGRDSLQTIRSLNTDYLVMISLVKDARATIEREQALKFVRAFLDVKDGVHEIAPGIVRVIVAIAQYADDRLRPMCLMTLAEILIRCPEMVVSTSGIGVLCDAMGNGIYHAPDTLTACFLHLIDLPARRNFLRSGFELSVPFASFIEPFDEQSSDEKLRASSRVIASLFQSWAGLTALTMHDFLCVRSLVSSLYVTNIPIRTVILDLIFEILRIRPASWSSTFLAGRRLTTYGRVANLKSDYRSPGEKITEGSEQRVSLVDHFTAVVLAVLLKCGLMAGLSSAEKDAPNQALKRRTTLLIGEVLSLANQLLPSSWSAELQTLPDLFNSATKFDSEDRFLAVATVYQVDSVNRTLYRSLRTDGSPALSKSVSVTGLTQATAKQAEQSRTTLPAAMEETQFRALMLDSQVLATVNFVKWDWDLISGMIDGPLTNPKRLDEATKATKFVHRLLAFFRPFKHRFSDVRNTRANQRYIRAGCNLIRVLLQTQEGYKYLAENKFLPQIAECLAQWDRMSGITSATPLFSIERLSDTLVAGYFPMLGVLTADTRGLALLESRKIMNMLYHLVELKDRDDLVTLILSNLDYVLDSHPRIILAKALVSGSRNVRILATRMLRKYAVKPMDEGTAWAIRLLVAQLYDTEIAVCEVAIKILEEASNSNEGLEYVVNCRPALDHLGEIGAPLLLRFLSSSIGYHYLDGLDYITKEMDDWFLGRNDTYVTLVEASLARSLKGDASDQINSSRSNLLSSTISNPFLDDISTPIDPAPGVPPHFYKELTRTAEGCKLLASKGHFSDFVATILDNGLESVDPELILKVKGCLWAVGNVGSMPLGAPFLDDSNVTLRIIQIAQESEVLSVRGTAFFVLGLISRSTHGQEILMENGWDGTIDVTGRSLGYYLPIDIRKLFDIKTWARLDVKDPLKQEYGKQHQVRAADDADEEESESNKAILGAVRRLGNSVVWNKVAAELNGYAFPFPPLSHYVSILMASSQL